MSVLILLIVVAGLALLWLTGWLYWLLISYLIAGRRAFRLYLSTHPPMPLPAPVQHHTPGRPGGQQ